VNPNINYVLRIIRYEYYILPYKITFINLLMYSP